MAGMAINSDLFKKGGEKKGFAYIFNLLFQSTDDFPLAINNLSMKIDHHSEKKIQRSVTMLMNKSVRLQSSPLTERPQ